MDQGAGLGACVARVQAEESRSATTTSARSVGYPTPGVVSDSSDDITNLIFAYETVLIVS